MKREKTTPFEVEQTLRQWGENLRTARIRRNMSLEEMADRIGVHRTVLSDVERGKPGTAVSAYIGMMWAMDMLPDMEHVAHPDNDHTGMALARIDERSRASGPRGMDNDF